MGLDRPNQIESFQQIVVPAKAGTHTPRTPFFAGWPTPTATMNAGGYGPLRSQGRRKGKKRPLRREGVTDQIIINMAALLSQGRHLCSLSFAMAEHLLT